MGFFELQRQGGRRIEREEELETAFPCERLKGSFSVFKLNEKKKKWKKIKSIGDDKILFITFDGCFFASANDFPGWKGNCIVFHYHRFDEFEYAFIKFVVGVFHLDGGDSGPLTSFPGYYNMLWPPPSWLWTDTGLLNIGESDMEGEREVPNSVQASKRRRHSLRRREMIFWRLTTPWVLSIRRRMKRKHHRRRRLGCS
ncbi:uncharacterized protein [Spinacia oleracea]|uniref:KIB1-4 beta-propeller domain-containing protein n=1 Tax=Spinacia oleracea TaxID=3562 RepID=A0ABM3QLY7_SPIOL|nr:uncharacterized protein LOC130460808 [Spinacia oleracea]